jgi:hypothetical protein
VFEPERDETVIGYCQLRQSNAGVSIWDAVKSFNDPLDDVRQTKNACVWTYDDKTPSNSADELDGSGETGGWLSPFDPVENLQHQLKNLLSMNASMQFKYLNFASATTGLHSRYGVLNFEHKLFTLEECCWGSRCWWG